MRFIQFLLFPTLIFLSCSVQAQSDSLKSALSKLMESKSEYAVPSQQHEDSLQNPQLTGIGRINVISDEAILKLEEDSRGFKDTKGYRIQIMLGAIQNIKTERNRFLSLGLPYSVYMKQIVPEYSLQVGDFQTRLDAEKNLQVIQQHYPKAFVISEFIEPVRFQTKK